jgi:hypothetical protein
MFFAGVPVVGIRNGVATFSSPLCLKRSFPFIKRCDLVAGENPESARQTVIDPRAIRIDSFISIASCEEVIRTPKSFRSGVEIVVRKSGRLLSTPHISRVGQQHISADPMQVTAKIVSLIDTVRYGT